MNEHSFIRAVHRNLPSELFRWKIHDTFAGGVPDAFYAGPASTLFVEYKYLKTLPKRDDTYLRTSLSPQQIHWLNTMHDYTQPVAVVIGAEQSAVVLLDKRWNTNISRSHFLKAAISFTEIANWIHNVCFKSYKAQKECLLTRSP
jgi:hypothetical protein